jgi:plastocyanin
VKDHRISKKPLLALALAVLAFGAACGNSDKDKGASGTTTSTLTASGAVTHAPITTQAGINDPAQRAVAVAQYMPAGATVAVGQVVRWSWAGTSEPHSVTFLPAGQSLPPPGTDQALFAPTPPKGAFDGTAMVNSGLVPLGPQAAPPFELTFSKPGRYPYQCVIHPPMVGTIDVVAAGQQGDTAADVDTRGAQEKGQWVAEGEAALSALQSAAPASTKNPDGTTTWKVVMGATTAHTDILAFAPVPAAVKPGDKVTFVNNSGAPHTATFFGQQPPTESPEDPRTDQAIPGPSPQRVNAKDLFNPGELPPNAPPGAGPPEAARSFTFVVPAAGGYSYVCIFHAPSGMAGVIKAA